MHVMDNALTFDIGRTTVQMIYRGPLDLPPADYLYAVRMDEGWEIYDDENDRIEGLPANMAIDYCNKIFLPDTILEKGVKHYFELKEIEDDE